MPEVDKLAKQGKQFHLTTPVGSLEGDQIIFEASPPAKF